MRCPSGKRSYQSTEEALEALIGARIYFHIREHGGPVNFYECRDCGEYHLTSQGEVHPELETDEVRQRIKLEREANEWERRLR